MRITQKDIARDLGISLITVSRAFNNSGYVSEGLKKRILDYAGKKAYVPHRASQVLVRNTIRTLALFSSADPEYFWHDIKKGALGAAEHLKPFNYEVHYHRIPDFDTEKYIKALKQEIKAGLDAAAFVNQRIFRMQAILDVAEKAGIPYLLYNVDDPRTNRLCYIGSNYRSGGRLAANFIGKALNIKRGGKVLVIGFIQGHEDEIPGTDINSERIQGFFSVMDEQYPALHCRTEFISSKSKRSIPRQIHELLKKYEHRVDAVYFIPAFNTGFLGALERLDYSNTITVLHDIDDSALHYLDINLLTAVVYQDPVLQGYTTVMTLEHILESKIRDRQRDVEIIHTLIFKENTGFLRNYILTEFEG
jgi:LacI family transcriptional regulator